MANLRLLTYPVMILVRVRQPMINDFEFQKKLMQIFSWMSAAITSQRLYLSHNPYIADNIEKAYR